MKATIRAVVLLLTIAPAARAACPGDYDDGFGSGGIVLQQFPEPIYVGASADTAIAGDGSILVLSDAWVGDQAVLKPIVLRYEPDGSLDESFGDGGLVIVDTPAIAIGIDVQPDGRIVVNYGKLVPPERDTFSPGIVRLLEDGTVDTEFGEDGFVVLDRGRKTYSRDVIVRSDGTIVVAGQERDTEYSWKAYVYFLGEDGNLLDAVELLGNESAVATGVVELEEGAIAVGGTILDDFTSATYVARLDVGGELVGAFADGGVRRFAAAGANEETWRIEVDGDGRIYTAGNAAPSYSGRRSRIVVRRVLPDGRPDPAFGARGKRVMKFQRRQYPRGLAVSAQGEAVVSSSGGGGALLARLTNEGRRDRSFGAHGFFRIGAASFSRVAVQHDGKIVANGYDGATASQLLVRLEGGTWDGVEACVLGCGDGVKQPRERCDDGNTANGDGCSAACLIE